jgi:hypothetical protein
MQSGDISRHPPAIPRAPATALALAFALAPALALAPAPARAAATPAGAPLTPADVDAALEARWPAGTRPAPPTGDDTFLRRVYLDLVGVIPSAAAVATYRADRSGDKRARLVELLLSTRRFCERWAEVLRQLVLGRTGNRDQAMLRALDHWLGERLARRGVGLDRIAREIVSAEGTPMDNPAVTVLLSFDDSREDITGQLARSFLGVQIQCAQCHDHPFEKWKQTDFYGMTAFFGRTQKVQIPRQAYEKLRSGEIRDASELARMLPAERRPPANPNHPQMKRIRWGIDRLAAVWARARSDPLAYRGADTLGEAADAMGMGAMLADLKKQKKEPQDLPLLIDAPEGEVELPAAGSPGARPAGGAGRTRPGAAAAAPPAPIRPRFLDGREAPFPDPGAARRTVLAAWMTAPDNPWFARAMANRVWTRLMGRGLVEPVDNVASPADATHAQLLERLARFLVDRAFDLRALIRLVVSTRAYQRIVAPATAGRSHAFDHALIRPLEPEQIFASILEASDVEHSFSEGTGQNFEEMRHRFLRQFVHNYRVDEPGETVSFQGTVSQALFTLNSPAFNRPVRATPGGTVDALRRNPDTPARVRELSIRAFARDPAPEEVKRVTEYLKERTRPDAPRMKVHRRMDAMWKAYEDVLWAMFASTEFLTNH